jgi:hypothetical protein
MARKPNYQHEKRQRELERKAKKEEKAQRRQERAASGEPDVDDGIAWPGAGEVAEANAGDDSTADAERNPGS